jgi:hypothetical protein
MTVRETRYNRRLYRKSIRQLVFDALLANSRIFLIIKLIATAAGAYIPDGINGVVIPNSEVSQNSTYSC